MVGPVAKLLCHINQQRFGLCILHCAHCAHNAFPQWKKTNLLSHINQQKLRIVHHDHSLQGSAIFCNGLYIASLQGKLKSCKRLSESPIPPPLDSGRGSPKGAPQKLHFMPKTYNKFVDLGIPFWTNSVSWVCMTSQATCHLPKRS